MAEEKKETTESSQELPAGSTPTLPRSRTTWPDLVGLAAEEAERKIKEDIPGAFVQVVPPNSCVTTDFRSNRVRLQVDSSGKVARAPKVG